MVRVRVHCYVWWWMEIAAATFNSAIRISNCWQRNEDAKRRNLIIRFWNLYSVCWSRSDWIISHRYSSRQQFASRSQIDYALLNHSCDLDAESVYYVVCVCVCWMLRLLFIVCTLHTVHSKRLWCICNQNKVSYARSFVASPKLCLFAIKMVCSASYT